MRNLIEKLSFQYHSLSDENQIIVDVIVLVGFAFFACLLFVLIVNLIVIL